METHFPILQPMNSSPNKLFCSSFSKYTLQSSNYILSEYTLESLLNLLLSKVPLFLKICPKVQTIQSRPSRNPIHSSRENLPKCPWNEIRCFLPSFTLNLGIGLITDKYLAYLAITKVCVYDKLKISGTALISNICFCVSHGSELKA